jgi:hypothetical protein
MRPLIPVLIALSIFAGISKATCQDVPPPQPHQFDLQISNLFGFVQPNSLVRVREFQTEGTGLNLPNDLGIHEIDLPEIDATYWFDEWNAAWFQFRDFEGGGTKFRAQPVLYNGTPIAGNQVLNSRGDEWFSFALYYQRRLPRLLDYLNVPALEGIDLRGSIGLEYTYLDFEIVKPKLSPTAKGTETKEDFYHQEVPMPTIALELRRQLNEQFALDGFFKGNWINRWNSLRNEGGTVWASQSGVEMHLRLLYSNPQFLGPIRPMLGIAWYYYSQLEDSREDGNFIRLSAVGPEVGIQASF